MGSLRAEMVVKPTMSLKYMVTWSKYSGSTVAPVFRASATDLEGWDGSQGRRIPFPQFGGKGGGRGGYFGGNPGLNVRRSGTGLLMFWLPSSKCLSLSGHDFL